MDVILYLPLEDGRGELIKKLTDIIVHVDRAEVYRTVETFSSRLKQPTEDTPIALLLAPSKKDLREILSISDLLSDIRIILILPDREDDTIAKGHSLHPRFLSYLDSDFKEIADVMGKMLEGERSILT